MSNFTDIPIILINKYIWDLASGSVSGQPAVASAVWNVNNYQFKPFYPVHEILAPNTSEMPYILYDYIIGTRPGTFWPIQKEEAQYLIVGQIPSIYYVRNFIVDSLEKFDTSASDVNQHLKSSSATINFKYITVEQDDYILEERKIDNENPKFITCLKVCYEYTK